MEQRRTDVTLFTLLGLCKHECLGKQSAGFLISSKIDKVMAEGRGHPMQDHLAGGQSANPGNF